MSDEDLPEISAKMDDFDYANEDDADDYFSVVLYKHSDGRHFRWIDASGMNSVFVGALGFDQWISDDQIANWKNVRTLDT